ncbi:MAG TPA: CHAT domain-containing protein [Gemmatimonadaceae bacterium]|nr:CHAT domain-containing protein [Gemmatimonadaceae bacterium]
MLPLLVALTLAAASEPDPARGAREIVRDAEIAVERGDTAVYMATWRRRWTADSSDPAAIFARGTIERLTYRYSEAFRDFSRLKALPAAQPGWAAYAALGEAEMLFISGRYAEAGTASTAALAQARAASDSSAQVLALVSLGILRLRTHPPAVGLATFDSAARVLPSGDAELSARVRCGRASVLARTARLVAVSEARSGAALAHQAGARRVEVNCLHIAASAYERLGRLYAADRLLDTAAALARQLGDRRELATILQWRGYAAFERQQFDSAQRLLGRALIEGELAGSLSPQAWSSENLAEVSMALDDPVSAEAHMTRALALMRKLGDQWGTTVSLGLLAEAALSSGDLDHAQQLYTELVDRATQSTDTSLVGDFEVRLAAIAARRHDWAAASAQLDRAADAYRHTGRRGTQVAFYYERGLIALWRGDPATAERLFKSDLATSDTGEHVSRYLAQTRLASARLARADTGDAERWLTRATDELDNWRRSLSDSSLRVLAFQVLDRFGGEELGTASVLAAIAASGHTAAAFELAERRRARELRDRLLRARSVRALGDHRRELPAISQRAPLTLDAVRRAIPDSNTALLELITGRGVQPTTMIAVTTGGSFVWRLPPVDSMRAGIARWLAVIGSDLSDSIPSAQLGGMLLAPAIARLPASITRLIIIPEDALHRVPFAALRVDGRRLIERYAVHVAPSAAIAVSLWSVPAAARPPRMLAFGDPHFPHDDPLDAPETRAHFAVFAAQGGLTSLPGSADEARTAARFWPQSDVLLGDAASQANLERRRVDQYRLLHFATHTQVDERAPGRSAIALAAGGGFDGFVSAADLGALRLDADLVMLSGCGTALGPIVGGEGILGLTSALLEAGAHSVVATLWPVSDRSSVALVEGFYRALASGAAASDALRSAQLEALRHRAPTRDWAAFELTGNGFVRPATRATRATPTRAASGR